MLQKHSTFRGTHRCAICLDDMADLVPTDRESGRYGFVFQVKCKCDASSSHECAAGVKCDPNARYVVKRLHKGEEDTSQNVGGVDYDSSTLEEIEREIAYTKKFASLPNFVQLVRALPDQGVLLLEYAGESLQVGKHYVHLKNLMRDADVILSALRRRSVVHRDIYERNLCVSPAGERLVLIDFGRASRPNAEHDRLLGEYIAPWVARGDTPYNAQYRDDEWAMALTFLQMVHGSDRIHPMCPTLPGEASHVELDRFKKKSVQKLYRSPKHLGKLWRACFDNIHARRYHTDEPRISQLHDAPVSAQHATQ